MQRLQQLDMRTIGGQGLLDDDELEMGMLPPQRGQQAFGRVAFTIVLSGPILPGNRLGGQGNHCALIGMDDQCP